ncbi:MAG: helix-turn-helix transcriptional regulator [Desulfovibrio sp.]|uniref:helix-turn-helix domain-containing protein n=1 Tax=Desulfovibrio sp. TaxID=885 RepID=UPI001A6FEAD1|nr:helix-turn-helix domain-containing protein [Desulfovibrio sp.]MBD5416130.1 helix-turn-helix transcriptional regulator [Desulfovibrio sp.]
MEMEDYPLLKRAFANVLKAKREELSLSKLKLAQMAKLERVYLIQLEKGDKRPTVNALFYLSEAVGLKPSEMLALVEEEIERLNGGE